MLISIVLVACIPFQTQPFLFLENMTTKYPGKTQIPNGNGQVFEGYVVDLLLELAGIINFQFSLQCVKDNKYGNQEDNGTWNGMIGEIVNGVSILPATLSYMPIYA